MTKHVVSSLVFLLGVGALSAAAEDWPMYQFDNARSGVTEEQLSLPLTEIWVHKTMHAPKPAWPAPAPRDLWHELPELKPLTTYDRAFHVVSVGDTVFFASSADDSVRALDASTGQERWRFFTEGPVRLAPTVANGKVYFGSDDGSVYCLRAADGSLLWQHTIDPNARRFPGNGRMVSEFPVRTSVLVDGGKVYYFAGLFPNQGVYRCALNAEDGSVIWQERVSEVSPQGYLLASPTGLYAPTGRTTPALFNKETGEYLSSLGDTGGTYALLVDDYMYNRAGSAGMVGLSDTTTGERIATFDGLHMIVKGEMAYLHTRDRLSALNRIRHTELARERNTVAARVKEVEKLLDEGAPEADVPTLKGELAQGKIALRKLHEAMEACFTWKQACDAPYSLILAGGTLFAGGDDKVLAFNRGDGGRPWFSVVRGKAYGLAVANGKLFVSTDEGYIHCFSATGTERGIVADSATPGALYPEDALSSVYADVTEQIVETTGADKGYCLVLGSEDGRLAYELAQRTALTIVAVEEDAEKVRQSRETLAKAGLNGTRVTVHHGSLDTLPYATYLFNLIVSDSMLLTGEPPCSAAEVFRLLRPYGGVAYLGQPKETDGLKRPRLREWLDEAGDLEAEVDVVKHKGAWAVIRRGAVPNSGEWTQLYANASHTACSGDEVRGPMAIQWFGEPGPRRIVDRHHRPMSSLVKDGRVFVPGDDVVFAVDAYNGTPLWELEVPSMRRVGALKNCGHMLLTDKLLYVAAQETCWLVDVETGEHVATLEAPQLREGETLDWGYLNQVGEWLYGTGQVKGASFRTLYKETCNILEGDFRPVIASRYLFSVNRHTGEPRWTYRDGLIMNNDIAIGDGRLYLVESRNETAKADDDGRIGIREFCAGETFLVTLDPETGRKLNEIPFAFPFEHIMFLNYAENTVLVSGTHNRDGKVFYGLFAFHGDTGQPKWQTEYLALDIRGNDPSPTEGSHGEQWQHPVIIGDRIYSRPYDFDLHTGEKGTKWIKRGGHGCGGWTASAHYLYGRGSNPRRYDLSLDDTEGEMLTQVSRPGCWLNIIPAGGLVLIPESSSGCTCSYPLQTSLALAPREAGLP